MKIVGFGDFLIHFSPYHDERFMQADMMRMPFTGAEASGGSGYQSSLKILPAYYDVTLKGKVSRDNDSGDMLDIIYSNIKLDLTILLAEQLPVDTNMRNFLINNTTDFVSTIASLKSQCETKLQKDVETILALEH